jgi:hypothetical protein
MFHSFRNKLTATAARSAAAITIAALIGVGTAAADISKVTVNNAGKMPLKVVILDAVAEIGRTSDFKAGSFDVTLKKPTSKYHWQVFAQGDTVPCQQARDATTPSITVQCKGVEAVTVNNAGKIPLKVVILDMGKYDIGRTPDYKLGSIPAITLNKPVTKYHWEVFAPGDQEPCQIGHNETNSSITVQCQHSKTEEKPPLQPIALPKLISDLTTKWEDKCAPSGGPFGAGGAVATCCSRQRRVEAACQTAPGTLDRSSSCDVAEHTCQETVLERAPSRLK